MAHRHKAALVRKLHSERTHGNIVYEYCDCGARRVTEYNGDAAVSDDWRTRDSWRWGNVPAVPR